MTSCKTDSSPLFTAEEMSVGGPAFCARIDRTGFGVFRTVGSVNLKKRLKEEADQAVTSLRRAERDDGVLRYRAGITYLGEQAQAFLTGRPLLSCLRQLTGERLRLTVEMSCLTVYEEGDQLGPHLDQPAEKCRVTFIFYLACRSPDPGNARTGLQLKVYGEERASIRRPPKQVIKTMAGAFVIGRGAQVWHERPRLQKGEQVQALTACFGAA